MKNFQHDCDLSLEYVFRRQTPLVASRAARACFCFGPSVSDSKSSTTDARVATTDQSKVAQQSGSQGITATDTAKAQNLAGSAGSAAASDKAISTSGTGNTVNKGGLQITDAKGNVTVTTSDPATITAALAKVGDLANSALSAASASADKTNAILGTLSESKQTDGASGVNKNNTIVASLTVIAAVVGIVAFARGKK